jgi:hypothetical protein
VGFAKRSFDIAKDVVQSKMTQDNAKEGRSIWYWITLGLMFAAFFTVALS